MRRALLLTLVSIAIFFSIALAAIAQDDHTEVPTPERREVDEASLTPEARARRAKIVAKVGDATITIGDVEDSINAQTPFVRARYRDPAQLREFVDGMIRFELLARAAERAEMSEDDEVDRTSKQNAVQQLIRRDFDERITPESISDADVQAYYTAHPEEFSREEMRRAAHVQLGSRQEAERLLSKVREADAREFRRLAREQSVDPETRLRGGDLRYFDAEGHPRNESDPRIDEALARAAFALAEVGDVSAQPIQVGERWSVVKLTGRSPAQHRALEQAAPEIRLRLWRQRRQDELDQFVARLRREARVQAHYDRMRPIRLDPPPREDRDDEHAREGRPLQMPPLETPSQNRAPAQTEEP
jgi:peptidyl-prolyl cis-trans isomerase C